MDKESDKTNEFKFLKFNLKPLVVFFDEVIAFTDRFEKKADKDNVKSKEANIARLGREAGIFIYVGTQRADADYFSGRARDNLFIRVALGSLSDEAHKMIFGKMDKVSYQMDVQNGYFYVQSCMMNAKSFTEPTIPCDYMDKLKKYAEKQVM